MDQREIKQKLKEIAIAVEGTGHPVVFTSIFGSHNYGLECENSDLDVYVVVMPTVTTFMNMKDAIVTKNIADCEVVVCDIRKFVQLMGRGQFRECEALRSRYLQPTEEYQPLTDALITLFHDYEGINEWRWHLLRAVHGQTSSYLSRLAEEKQKDVSDHSKASKYAATLMYFSQFAERYFQHGESFEQAIVNNDEFLVYLKNDAIPFPPMALLEMGQEIEARWPQFAPLDDGISKRWRADSEKDYQYLATLIRIMFGNPRA